MRTKLRRALAHLKAAARHIEEAKRIINGPRCWIYACDTVLSNAATSLGSAVYDVKRQYSDVEFAIIEPAELS